jgi:hypothetical protein
VWSDPLGASCNDYDLYVLNSTMSTVMAYSTSTQSCTQDPYEYVTTPPAVGYRIVIVKYSGVARALHVDTNRGRLAIATSGATIGHNAGAATLTVAATPAQATIFTSGNQTPESYSSDGPRKIFYSPNGTPITPGNFLFATNGGTTLAKVDFTFQWTAGAASQCVLWIGSTGVGSSNFGGTGATTSTSYGATGLPTDGRTMYVRLWSQISGTWLYNDYTYTAL